MPLQSDGSCGLDMDWSKRGANLAKENPKKPPVEKSNPDCVSSGSPEMTGKCGSIDITIFYLWVDGKATYILNKAEAELILWVVRKNHRIDCQIRSLYLKLLYFDEYKDNVIRKEAKRRVALERDPGVNSLATYDIYSPLFFLYENQIQSFRKEIGRLKQYKEIGKFFI